MKRPIYAWKFKSSSGSKVYETLQYTDSSLSCDCPGWCRRIAPDGSRTCKHVRAVLLSEWGGIDLVTHGAVGGASAPKPIVVQPKPPTIPPAAHQPLKRKLNV